MSISSQDYESLKEHLGEAWAKWVYNATEAQGKAVAGAGLAFKQLPGIARKMPEEEDEDEKADNPFADEDEDEKADNPFADEDEDEEKQFTNVNYAVLGGLKQLTNHLAATHKELDRTRKQVKDLSNQVHNSNKELGAMKDSVRRIEQYLGKLVTRQPATKSNAVYKGGNQLIDEVVTENHKSSPAPLPLLNQMQKNIEIPTAE